MALCTCIMWQKESHLTLWNSEEEIRDDLLEEVVLKVEPQLKVEASAEGQLDIK